MILLVRPRGAGFCMRATCIAMVEAPSRAPRPVSYTHLDVYKRQLIAVIVGVLFALILFYKFVDWVGPYSGGLSSQEVGKGSVAGR